MISIQDVAALVARFKKRILYISVYVLIVSCLVYPFMGGFILRMRDDLLHGKQFALIQTQPLELMMLELKMSLIVGAISALPIIFYYTYRFLKGRKLGERVKIKISKAKIIAFLGTFIVLFVLGCLYSYYLMLPLVFQYLLDSATEIGVVNNWRVSEFMNFAMMTTLVFGLVFELPLVMTVLARSGLVPVEIFKKYRRHMYVIILIVAALVTSPDVITQIMVGVPLIIFYEVSILLLRFTAPRSRANKDKMETV